MSPFDRHLQAAEGYVELGLPWEANEELECIPSRQKTDPRVLVLRVDVLRLLAKWEPMEALARTLAERLPGVPFGWINWAYAARRKQGLPTARDILLQARKHLQNEASIEYILACYECQLGRLSEARDCLGKALELDKNYRWLASTDPDLTPLRGATQPLTTSKRKRKTK